MHAAGVRVHGDDGPADFRDLHQRPRPGGVGSILGRHPDHIAVREDVVDRPRRSARGLRPLHLLEGDLDRLPLGDIAAVGLAARAQAHHRLAPLRIEDDTKPPGREIVGNFHAAQGRAPIPGDVDALHGPAPAFFTIKSDEAIDQCLARRALQFRIQRGTYGKAAVDAAVGDPGTLRAPVEAVLADHLHQPAAHLFGKIIGRINLRAERANVDGESLELGGFGLSPLM